MGHSVQKVDTHTRTREIREHTHDARHGNTHTTCIYIAFTEMLRSTWSYSFFVKYRS